MKFLVLISLIFSNSCSSYKEFQSLREEEAVPSKTVPYNFDQTWQATLQVMQKFDLSSQSQELGVIKTRFIDNTVELNFADSFGKEESIKSAKFKLIVSVKSQDRLTRAETKISIYKRKWSKKNFFKVPNLYEATGIWRPLSCTGLGEF